MLETTVYDCSQYFGLQQKVTEAGTVNGDVRAFDILLGLQRRLSYRLLIIVLIIQQIVIWVCHCNVSRDFELFFVFFQSRWRFCGKGDKINTRIWSLCRMKKVQSQPSICLSLRLQMEDALTEFAFDLQSARRTAFPMDFSCLGGDIEVRSRLLMSASPLVRSKWLLIMMKSEDAAWLVRTFELRPLFSDFKGRILSATCNSIVVGRTWG